jgi:hypothetical protein
MTIRSMPLRLPLVYSAVHVYYDPVTSSCDYMRFNWRSRTRWGVLRDGMRPLVLVDCSQVPKAYRSSLVESMVGTALFMYKRDALKVAKALTILDA